MKGINFVITLVFIVGCYILGNNLEQLIEMFGKDLPDWTGMKIGVVLMDIMVLVLFGRMLLRQDKD